LKKPYHTKLSRLEQLRLLCEGLTLNEVIDILNRPKIITTRKELILSPHYKSWLAQELVKKELSRIKTSSWLAGKIYRYKGVIYLNKNQILNTHPDIVDQVFGRDDACSWASAVKRFANRLPQRSSSDRELLKLQLFDAALRIENIIYDPYIILTFKK